MKKRNTGSSSLDRRTHSHRSTDLSASVKAALQAMDFTPSRHRGQNFLIDATVARNEVALVDLPPGSAVVEIGGGLGMLSTALLERGFRPLTILEVDERLASVLEANFTGRATVLRVDALESPLPPADAYVGNLPFSIATPLLLRLLEMGIPHGVFLVQREVAERLSAAHGNRDYGPLTIQARLYGEFVTAGIVPRTAFFPLPRVDGALVVYRAAPLMPAPRDRELLMQLVRRTFSWRRKQLHHTLPFVLHEFGVPETATSSLLEAVALPSEWGSLRPEDLSPECYVKLSLALSDLQP